MSFIYLTKERDIEKQKISEIQDRMFWRIQLIAFGSFLALIVIVLDMAINSDYMLSIDHPEFFEVLFEFFRQHFWAILAFFVAGNFLQILRIRSDKKDLEKHKENLKKLRGSSRPN